MASGVQVDRGAEAKLVEDIRALQSGLQASAVNSLAAVDTLRAFESRVSAFEESLRPLREVSGKLTEAQRNIDRTLAQLEKAHTHFRCAEETRPLLSAPALLKSSNQEQRERYFEAAARVAAARQWLDQHRDFASTPSALSELGALAAQAQRGLLSELAAILSRHAVSGEAYLAWLAHAKAAAAARRRGDLGWGLDDGLAPEGAEQATEVESPAARHARLPNDVGERVRELVSALERLGAQSALALSYGELRGALVASAIDELAAPLSAPLVAVAEEEPDDVFAAAAAASGSPPGSPRAAPYLPPTAPAAGAEGIAPVADGGADPGESLDVVGELPGSDKGRKKSGWGLSRVKNKLFHRKEVKNEVKSAAHSSIASSSSVAGATGGGMPAELGAAPTTRAPQMLNKEPEQAPPSPPAPSAKSLFGGRKSSSGDGSSKARREERAATEAQAQERELRRYVKGQHVMLDVVDGTVQMVSAERALALRALPPGAAGREVFLRAMSPPIVALVRAADRALERANVEFVKAEAALALLDVDKALRTAQPELRAALEPRGASSGAGTLPHAAGALAGAVSLPARPASPPSASLGLSAAAAEPWSQVSELLERWHSASAHALSQARAALAQPLETHPEARVHPRSVRVASFCRRLVGERIAVGALIVSAAAPGEHHEPSAAQVDKQVRALVESLVDDFVATALPSGPSPEVAPAAHGCAEWLFRLNNARVVVAGVMEDDAVAGLLAGSRYPQRWAAAVDEAKLAFVACAVAAGRPVLDSQRIEELTRRYSANTQLPVSEEHRRELKAACSALRAWIQGAHAACSKLEVPDFELRTELRFLVRSAVLQRYTELHERLLLIDFSGAKEEKYLPFYPQLLSTMISQFFEVSETSSDPAALATAPHVEQRPSHLARMASSIVQAPMRLF
jgi:hypothetical protein